MASGSAARLPKMSERGIDLRYVRPARGQQAHALERGAVLGSVALVFGAAVEEIEDRARQATFREDAQVLDVHRRQVRHNWRLTLPSKAKSVSRLLRLPPPPFLPARSSPELSPQAAAASSALHPPARSTSPRARPPPSSPRSLASRSRSITSPARAATSVALEAARSAPDGYTLFMSTSGIQAINPFLYAKMPFDPNKDLASVAPIVSLNNVLVLHPSVPAKSVKEVIDLAKKEPGKWTYASSGNGTSIHMSAAMFTQMTETNILHIPYKGSGPAVTDLLGGQHDVRQHPSSLPHIKAGKLRALATTGEARPGPARPADARGGRHQGLRVGRMVRPHGAGRHAEEIMRLNAAAVQVTKAPEFIKRMTDLGYNIIPGTPEDMTNAIQAEPQALGTHRESFRSEDRLMKTRQQGEAHRGRPRARHHAVQEGLLPDAERFVRHCRCAQMGLRGLAVFGTNSEANSMSVAEKRLLEALVAGGVPAATLMPGTGHCALSDSIEMTRAAVEPRLRRRADAAALLLQGRLRRGLYRNFAEVIERVGDERLSLYLYHIPPVAQVAITLPLIERLLSKYPGIVPGVKDSRASGPNTKAMLDHFAKGGFDVFAGSEVFLLDNMRHGGKGCITATGNINPGRSPTSTRTGARQKPTSCKPASPQRARSCRSSR